MYYKENSQHSLTSQLSSKSTESLQLRSDGGGCSFGEDINLLYNNSNIQPESRRVSFDSNNSVLVHPYDWNDPETMV